MPVDRRPYRVLIYLDKILGLLAEPVAGETPGESAELIDVPSADEIPEEDLAEMEEAVEETVDLNVQLRGLDAREAGEVERLVRSLVYGCWRLRRPLPPPMDVRSDVWRELSDDVGRAYERAREAFGTTAG